LRPILDAIARRDDPASLRQRMLSQAPFQENRVKSFLHIRMARGQFVEE
jgi:hypothetical protein